MTSQSSGPWPAFYPEDVPPAYAAPAAGQAFRIVSQIPSMPRDFQSRYELRPKDYGPLMWKACGVSFHTLLDDSVKTRNRYPPLRSKRIAMGLLTEIIGVMAPTPAPSAPSHLTVWIRTTAKPHDSFVFNAE